MDGKPKTTPKDFFLWLGAMIALYVSATSLILLFHQYIDALLPDRAVVYGDPYSGPIRFAFASLIVMFPLFVWFMRILHKDIRTNPEKKEIWVRRWMVFLTIFLAGLTMAIDVIATIYVYLQGDLSVRFVLKALAILLVLGSGFWYFLEELKGTWERKAKLSMGIAAVVSAAVLISLGASFFIIGSPQTARLAKLDQQRLSDLQNIQWQVVSFWQQKEKLPASMADLEDPLSGFVAPKDPETGEAYVYKAGEGMSFSLCATFSLESSDASDMTMPALPDDQNWKHGKGEACFERVIDPDRYPPYPKNSR